MTYEDKHVPEPPIAFIHTDQRREERRKIHYAEVDGERRSSARRAIDRMQATPDEIHRIAAAENYHKHVAD